MQNQNLLTPQFYRELECVGKYACAANPNKSKLIEVVQNKYDCLIVDALEYKYKFSGGGLIVEDNNRLYLQTLKNGSREYTPVVKVADDGVTCEFILNDFTYIGTLLSEWTKANASKYKIRMDQSFHIKKLFALIVGYVNHYLEKVGFAGKDLVQVNQQAQKEYLTSCVQNDLYCYATPSLENHSFDEMNRVILECYATQANSKSNSCMTKSGGDWTKMGSDFRGGSYEQCFSSGGEWIHPFQAYATRDWKFLFVSKYAPEEVLNWDNESKSPFIARSIAFNDNANNRESQQQWYIRYHNICYGAREIANPVFAHFFPRSENTDCCAIKLYHNGYDKIIMPYVDGNSQVCGVETRDNCVTIERTGEELCYDVAYMGDDSDDMYASRGGHAIAEIFFRMVWCEVLQDDVAMSDAEYISEINGWVSERFVDARGNLDGVAIFNHFRR